jgi:hypothetical protein
VHPRVQDLRHYLKSLRKKKRGPREGVQSIQEAFQANEMSAISVGVVSE